MNQAKFYKTLVIILVLLNLGTLFFLWSNKPPHHPRPEKHQISEMLKLKGEAKSFVEKLQTEHHIEKRELIQEDRELHNQLYLLVGKNDDPTAILEEIYFNKVKIEAMTFKYFDEIGKQCNQSQLKELKEHIKTALNNLSGPRRKGPPGRQ